MCTWVCVCVVESKGEKRERGRNVERKWRKGKEKKRVINLTVKNKFAIKNRLKNSLARVLDEDATIYFVEILQFGFSNFSEKNGR